MCIRDNFQAVDRDASKAEHGGDRYRRMEIEYICSHTIATQSDAGQQLCWPCCC